MCQQCRLSECDEFRNPCLCECHNMEYEPGWDEQPDDRELEVSRDEA